MTSARHPGSILIVSVRDDLHAHAIRHVVRARGRDCHIVECDAIGGRDALSWRSGREPSLLRTNEGLTVVVQDAAVLWWRRVRADQDHAAGLGSEHERSLVNNDCRGALAGVLAAGFTGEWVSRPEATDRAADKLFQLSVAQSSGFRIPRTLVTQSRDDVVAFRHQHERIIVKPVVGARGPLMYTQFLDDPAALPPEAYTACPAVYQEYVPGCDHLRVNCFGDRIHAALIRTDTLDWRPDLNVPVSRWPMPEDLGDRIRDVLRRLGLRMGVIDIKLTPDGEPVWLEVNPQGQFLFLEPLLGEPLAEHFADFLLAEAAGVTSELDLPRQPVA